MIDALAMYRLDETMNLFKKGETIGAWVSCRLIQYILAWKELTKDQIEVA